MTHHTHGEGKFVQRFEEAVMQFIILEKASKQGEVTRENIEQAFKGNLQMKYMHVDKCLDMLVQENHLKKDGNKFRITDDGREDVQEVQRVAVELSSIAGQNVGGGRVGQTGTTQGATTPTSLGGNQPGQPKGGPGNATGNR